MLSPGGAPGGRCLQCVLWAEKERVYQREIDALRRRPSPARHGADESPHSAPEVHRPGATGGVSAPPSAAAASKTVATADGRSTSWGGPSLRDVVARSPAAKTGSRSGSVAGGEPGHVVHHQDESHGPLLFSQGTMTLDLPPQTPAEARAADRLLARQRAEIAELQQEVQRLTIQVHGLQNDQLELLSERRFDSAAAVAHHAAALSGTPTLSYRAVSDRAQHDHFASGFGGSPRAPPGSVDAPPVSATLHSHSAVRSLAAEAGSASRSVEPVTPPGEGEAVPRTYRSPALMAYEGGM